MIKAESRKGDFVRSKVGGVLISKFIIGCSIFDI